MAKKGLIVKSRTRAFFRLHGHSCANGLIDAIDAEVEKMLEKAMKRAEANKRKTVKATDI